MTVRLRRGVARRAGPALVVFVTGTGTEVGKTWVTCVVTTLLRSRGRTISVRKPVQSHELSGGPSDAELLAGASGEDVADVCPAERTFEVALAPPMAARVLGRGVPGTAELAEGLCFADGADVGLIEGAGGLRSPISADGDNLDLIEAARPDLVVVVAESGLGVINGVRLLIDALGPRPVVAYLNRHDPVNEVEAASAAWLRDRDGTDVLVRAPDLADRLEGRLTTRSRP